MACDVHQKLDRNYIESKWFAHRTHQTAIARLCGILIKLKLWADLCLNRLSILSPINLEHIVDQLLLSLPPLLQAHQARPETGSSDVASTAHPSGFISQRHCKCPQMTPQPHGLWLHSSCGVRADLLPQEAAPPAPLFLGSVWKVQANQLLKGRTKNYSMLQ